MNDLIDVLKIAVAGTACHSLCRPGSNDSIAVVHILTVIRCRRRNHAEYVIDGERSLRVLQ